MTRKVVFCYSFTSEKQNNLYRNKKIYIVFCSFCIQKCDDVERIELNLAAGRSKVARLFLLCSSGFSCKQQLPRPLARCQPFWILALTWHFFSKLEIVKDLLGKISTLFVIKCLKYGSNNERLMAKKEPSIWELFKGIFFINNNQIYNRKN